MKHLGDIQLLVGSDIPPVDVIVGGSPCQDLSLAGSRNGFAGERSGLFLEQVRLTKEMYDATDGLYPRFLVWENVVGALSSNKGEDFASVITEIVRIAEPQAPRVQVPKKGWPTWGSYRDMDGRFSVAWRVADAQYWGVPQTRRRIMLLADFGSGRAAEILFECESRTGDSGESGTPWESRTRAAEKGHVDVSTYRLRSFSDYVKSDVASTLKARAYKFATDLILFENHSQDTRYTRRERTSPTISATFGMGGNNQPFVTDTNGTFVRRLTPLECERLQGYPDGWTAIEGASDTARYKALGNSIALPQWYWLLGELTRELGRRGTLGSLFDGIGGFPYCWELHNGKGSALWASEIEKFPIAVTNVRFPEPRDKWDWLNGVLACG